jgi:glycosyltransferase involved in cell wall biosynthesis
MSRRGDRAGDPAFDVVIVTPTYIASNPRVVKEADALADAGFRVCVVLSEGQLEWARQFDEALAAGRRWSMRPMRWGPAGGDERRTYLRSSIRFHLARRVPWSARGPVSLALRAECRTFPELAAAASEAHGRLYIGHYPEGLAAAAVAARRRHAAYAYDVEDLHTEELAPTVDGRRRSTRIETIERHHIGGCAYVSAASGGLADAIVERYGCRAPAVIHNVFPWSDRASIDHRTLDRKGAEPSLYWYSQVVGPDRGLQDVIRALGLVRARFQLHLRGSCSDEVARQLRMLAAEARISDRMFIHDRVAPAELLSRAAEHDIGLALEQPVSRSRELSVTNKLFFYLLAGLAVVATDLPGQRTVLRQMPGVGDMYAPGDYVALARTLEQLLHDPARLKNRRQAALNAARVRWNWESEQAMLVAAVEEVVGPGRHSENGRKVAHGAC